MHTLVFVRSPKVEEQKIIYQKDNQLLATCYIRKDGQ